MTEAEFKAKLEELMTDESFQAQLKGLKDCSAINELFVKNGLELTNEMLDGIMSKVDYYEENGELDEEMLDIVSGGKSFGEWLSFTLGGAGLGALGGGGAGAIAGGVICAVAYIIIG